jgi:DNA processing protein
VFAVPGSPLDPRCLGSNDLIRQGAHLTEGLSDVLDNLPDHPMRQGLARSPLFARGAPPAGLADGGADDREEAGPLAPDDHASVTALVLPLLGPSPTSVDDVIRRCQLSAPAVMSALLDLEIAGRVRSLPGNRVVLRADPAP